jgi:hypothetical protein
MAFLSLTHKKIQVWLVAPYKMPDADEPENRRFNNHVSMVRIRSEHAIGFLKGRFQSLKHLRVSITDEGSHIFATYWIAACIGLHSFVMQCEDDENPDRDTTNPGTRDRFIDEGLSSDESSDDDSNSRGTHRIWTTQQLQKAKEKRERLKRRLFRTLDEEDR